MAGLWCSIPWAKRSGPEVAWLLPQQQQPAGGWRRGRRGEERWLLSGRAAVLPRLKRASSHSASLKGWLLVLSFNRSFSGDFFGSFFFFFAFFFPSNGATWKDLLLLPTLCIHRVPAEYSFSRSRSLRPTVELVACPKRLEPVGHCRGGLEAVLAGCGDEEILTAPWGRVNPARSITRRQRLAHPRAPGLRQGAGPGGL